MHSAVTTPAPQREREAFAPSPAQREREAPAGVPLDRVPSAPDFLDRALAEARLQAAQGRIRLHFLLNGLNGVLALIRSDRGRAEAVLQDLADLVRAVMSAGPGTVSLAEELDLARAYVRIEQVRLGPRLRFDCRAAPEVLAVRVPPLVVQPLVENAVVHGIEPAGLTGCVDVEATWSDGRLRIRVASPLAAAGSRGGGSGLAIANVRDRLGIHYGADASLSAAPAGERFEAVLDLPASAQG